MNDEEIPQWSQRLTDQIQHGQNLTAVAIRDFESRREASQHELAAAMAANNAEREGELKWILPSIEEESAGLQRAQARYRQMQDRV